MGLFTWTINSMLTRKFWKHLINEGFLKTYTRGFRATRNPHQQGGQRSDTYVACKGQDEYGNKYYECFDVDQVYQTRWVEFATYFLTIWNIGDSVPPAYHGWLAHQYDDFPTKTGKSNFVKPFYQKPWSTNKSFTADFYYAPCSLANLNRMEYIYRQRDRSRKPWQVPEGNSKFQGKKILSQTKEYFFDDVMSYKD